jgi:hypothetical protein
MAICAPNKRYQVHSLFRNKVPNPNPLRSLNQVMTTIPFGSIDERKKCAMHESTWIRDLSQSRSMRLPVTMGFTSFTS